ncbi:family 16 glycosylhydrolase [Winogradskyella sp.]|uniref:family 16 glycosylhydrolase n=1 Tax=Winogradskyella sp. TaxID=1883156 RepID=UPI00260D1D47|nr:family 16 glycosylhydrolase [Winogradskyella sp.]
MKLNYALTFLFSFSMSLLFSQQMPIDFSNSSHNFNVWGGSTFGIVPSPTDANNPTGEFFRSGSTSEQGHYIDLSQPVDLDIEDQITLRFYAFDSNTHTVVVKLENGTNPDVEVSVAVPSNQDAWSDLTFDFSTVGGSGAYSRFVIRIDDGSAVPGAFRIDDINDGSIPGDPHELDVVYTDLVWSDEFDSTIPAAVDASKWHHQTFGPNGGQWFNGEEQHYTDRLDNSYVENGFLNIVAKSETLTQDGVTLNYTSARLNSKFAFTYGRVDVRAKLPEGEGTWPAIWTLGKNINETGAYWQTQGFGTTTWPACGELDIMEHGLHSTNEVSCAIHTPSSFGNTVNTATQFLSDVANDFHVYSMNWSPNQVTFMIDGVGYYTYNPAVKDANTWPFDLEQYLILNVAMGGISGGIDPSFAQSSMVIDYVRVYQNTGLSIDEVFGEKFRIYPNPTSNYINIKTDEPIDRVELYNILGQLVVGNKNSKSINVEELKTGCYILKIYSKDRSVSGRVVVN